MFQSFADIHVLLAAPPAEAVSNLKAHHKALLALLGKRYAAVYSNFG